MKKKLLFAGLSILIVGSSLAYLKDTDEVKNVMTAGNVKISISEKDRMGAEFENGQKLLPAVYPSGEGTLSQDGKATLKDGKEYGIWDKSVNNEIDKFITVTNEGTEDAYIRTVVLMENTEDNAICEKVHVLWCDTDGQNGVWVEKDGVRETVEIDGVKYSIAVCTYKTALGAGKISAPSMMQMYLDPTATNEWYDLVKDEQGVAQFNVLVLSQGVQTFGFDDAQTALDSAFGAVNSENVKTWFTQNN